MSTSCPAVVVEVGRRDAHSVELDLEAGRFRDVRERAAALVAIEPRRRARGLLPGPGRPVDEQHVLSPVVVVVEERGTRAERLRQVLAAEGAVACVKRMPEDAVTSTSVKPGRLLAPRATPASSRGEDQRGGRTGEDVDGTARRRPRAAGTRDQRRTRAAGAETPEPATDVRRAEALHPTRCRSPAGRLAP